MRDYLNALRVPGISRTDWLLCAGFAAVACWLLWPFLLLAGAWNKSIEGEPLDGLPEKALRAAVAVSGLFFFKVYTLPVILLGRAAALLAKRR